MKLTVFFSKDGDCVLLTGADGKMVLADGGRSSSYKAGVSEALNGLLQKGKELEAVYISHIDADHVEGIERMLEDLVDWAVFDFQTAQGTKVKRPKSFLSMKPKAIWHNSFNDQVPDKAVEITELLAASAAVLTGLSNSAPAEMQAVALEHGNLATSMAQAFNISAKIKKNLLNIKLNPDFDGKLMMLNDTGPLPKPIKIGGMNWHIIGPAEEDLEELRKEWEAWLKTVKGKDAIKKAKREAAEEEKDLGNSAGEVSMLTARRSREADLLAETLLSTDIALAAKKDGRDGVTTPNLASLMFLVEEKKGDVTQKILMTGDGHWKDILAGLKRQKKLDADGNLHVDVLKVQHHGATANLKPEFLEKVTADNYVFCGISAEHSNPERDVVNFVLDSRLVAGKKGTHAKVKNKFKLWFSSSSKNPSSNPADTAHIKMIEKLVASRANARFTSFFSNTSSFDLPL